MSPFPAVRADSGGFLPLRVSYSSSAPTFWNLRHRWQGLRVASVSFSNVSITFAIAPAIPGIGWLYVRARAHDLGPQAACLLFHIDPRDDAQLASLATLLLRDFPSHSWASRLVPPRACSRSREAAHRNDSSRRIVSSLLERQLLLLVWPTRWGAFDVGLRLRTCGFSMSLKLQMSVA
ncbi:hypothetical protein BD414DRAFT_488675 [Trametes punicea]|nr:hypothetical protein BD414DRAFT_488675 [Trametes punicea]